MTNLSRFNRQSLPSLIHATRGTRILNDVRAICKTDRWNSFDRFHDTTATLVERYESAGARAEVTPIKSGGQIGTGRWVIRETADVVSATADIIAPVRRRLLNYARNPWSVIQWSAATPADGLTGPLVIIDSHEAIQKHTGRSLEGRIVLTRLNVRNIVRDLSDRGAAAVITDTPVDGHPDAKAWTKFGWGAIGLEGSAARLVGLVLSTNEGITLRKLAKKGEVKLRLRVDVRPNVGTHDLVSGIIEGSGNPQDELWVLAHSAEPGAHDNASGVALCLETARVLESLIRKGAIERPKRTIRLLSGFECYSFFHYLEHQHRYQPPLAGLCVDTVGARPDICDGRLSWRATVPSSAGFVDRVGASIIRATLRQTRPGYRLAEGSFISTSDTQIGDPRYGFPCPWINTHLRRGDKAWKAYHSSADTTDVLSVEGLAACSAAVTGYLTYLADAGTSDLLEMAATETAHARTVLSRARSVDGADYIRQQHATSMTRLERWMWEGDRSVTLKQLDAERKSVDQMGPRTRPKALRGRNARIVPRRTRALAPTPENTPVPIKNQIAGAKLSQWALFWADGRRSLGEIARLLSIETGKEVTLDRVARYFNGHRELGYVDLVQSDNIIPRKKLIEDLRRLGLKTGMDVMVHSSLSSIGHVDGGAGTIIDALLSVLGRDGTLMMPSFNHRAALVYNPKTSRTTNGAIPDAFWRRNGVIRSNHPTHAVAAHGPKAESFCRDHLELGLWTAKSPIARLVAEGGYVLSLGVTYTSSTAYHVGELSVPCQCIDPFGGSGRIVTDSGKVQTVPGLAWRDGTCPVSPERLNQALEKHQRSGRVGVATATLVLARLIVEARRRHLRNVCPTCPIRPKP